MRAKQATDEIERALGAGGEIQIVPMFVPLETYKALSGLALNEGITTGQFLERAVVSYIRSREQAQKEVAREAPRPAPTITIRRR